LIATCAKHNSFITALDWSTDSKHIQSICGAYELLFFNAETGTQMPSNIYTFIFFKMKRWSNSFER